MDTGLSPVVKWAGGKEQELKYILPNVPSNISRYIEPFVGGGAVYFAMPVKEKLINDKSVELINLYNQIKNNNTEFVNKLENIQIAWNGLEDVLLNEQSFFYNTYYNYKNSNIDKEQLKQNLLLFIKDNYKAFSELLNNELSKFYNVFEKELIRNIFNKMLRMKELEHKKGDISAKDVMDNFECALKGSFYMFIRTLYNIDQHNNIEYFYFIREYCYSSMFRYNSNGGFNVPYGGISYNRKNMKRKINYIKSDALKKHLINTKIFNLDFEDFLDQIELKADDFIFLDPPYDTDFSSYVNNAFEKQDQERLADYLTNKCPANFMLIIKNTDFIKELYSRRGFYINNFDKKYMVSFKGRNNRDCEHLIISNYKLPTNENKVMPITYQKQLQYA